MTTPEQPFALGQECEHGQLARQCDMCELIRERDELKADAERWRNIVENGVPTGEVQWDKEGSAIYHWLLCGPGMELVRFSTLTEAVDARIAARKGKA